MSKKVFCDVIREVGEEGEEVLTVKPDPDFPAEHVLLMAVSEGAKEYWGDIRLSLPKALAAELGRALVEAAK